MSQTPLISWDIYEIHTAEAEIHGVMLRGRIRKLGLEQGFNALCENATDKENCVRFALLHGEDVKSVKDYLMGGIPDVVVELVAEDIVNPVLSKLKVNKKERYTL